ncbi:MAG: protein-L-isoaspartate(D-aspartate) O-methyltransferase [Bacteroidota bacterium]
MKDTYKHKGLRKKLVELIQMKGIMDVRVLKAVETVPRHLFLDDAFVEFAYKDKPFPIGAEQTISQPFTVAFQTELLKVKKGDKILEVGTGSGYQACILLEMGARVYTIERHKQLYMKAKVFLPRIGYHPKFFHGDGYKGLPAFARFDKIIVTAGAPYVPDALIEQLKIGGILVIPVGLSANQVMTTIVKVSETEHKKSEHGDFVFVPLLDDKTWD